MEIELYIIHLLWEARKEQSNFGVNDTKQQICRETIKKLIWLIRKNVGVAVLILTTVFPLPKALLKLTDKYT